MSFDPSRPFSVPPLPPIYVDLDSPALLKKVNKAMKELAELNGYSMGLPNPYLLMAPFMIQESVASSNIENINTTVVEFIQGQLFPEHEQRPPDKEVARYREALRWGHKNLGKLALTMRLIVGIQERLLENPENAYRRHQNRIENTSNKEILYTPPIASEVPMHMSALEKFANSENTEIDPLIRCALAHYQFEAIHPFADGNGRTGRILMVLQLVEYKLLNFPILFMSGYLNKNRSEYYRLLRGVTSSNAWTEFLEFMLEAYFQQALQTKTTLFQIMSMHDELKEALKAKHKSIYSADLVDHLFIQPITSPVRLGEALGIHYTTASKYLHTLAKAEILKSKKVGRHHLFANTRLVRLLQK
jgi:Fic family protein